MKKTILFLIFFLVCISLVSAVAPITTIFMGDEGLELESPTIQYVKLGTSGNIIVHVFNKSNGVLMESPDVSCFGTHNLPNGTDIASQLATPHNDHFHFNWNETSMPVIGLYSYTMYCNTSTNLGGYLLGYMQVTESGYEEHYTSLWGIALIVMGVLFIIAYLSRNTKDDIMKGLFSLIVVGLLFAAMDLARMFAVESNASNLFIKSIVIMEITTGTLMLAVLFFTFINFVKVILIKMGKLPGNTEK